MPGRRSDAKSNGRPRMPMATLVRRASRAGIAGSVLLAAVLAAPPAARAGEAGAGLPTGVCMPGSCGTAQRRIWQRFERGGGLDPATAAIVHSGVCYVRDRLYDPDRAHHVGFLIDGSDGGPLLFLRFSFYAAASSTGCCRYRCMTGTPMPTMPMRTSSRATGCAAMPPPAGCCWSPISATA
jgi:hypothetical protein